MRIRLLLAVTLEESELWLVSAALAFVELLGLLTAFHAIMHGRTPQGAIGWFFPLLLFPVIAVPLYWVFGRSRFQGYVVARRAGGSAMQQRVAEGLENFRREFGTRLEGPLERFQVLEALAQLPFSRGNTVRLLVDGEATFAAIFAGIESAREYILVQFYIINDDQLGREFKERLMVKARAGVRVLLQYDEIGCYHLPRSYLSELSAAGVEVRGFDTMRGWANRFQLNFRNHRKIVVVDGKEAFVGGLNVGDEYMGRNPRFGHWRDTHVAVRGPAVTCLQLSFAEDWFWSSQRELPNLNWQAELASEDGSRVLVLPTGPADQVESCGLFFTHLIHNARRRIWIASPYFVPDRDVTAALQLAALRGVDVRIILPQKPDHVLVYLSSYSFIEELSPLGIRFERYLPGFMHHKVVLVDDDFAAVGTANLDNRSFRLNFEVTVAVADPRFAAELEAMLERDLADTRETTAADLRAKPFWFPLVVQASRLMAPVQ